MTSLLITLAPPIDASVDARMLAAQVIGPGVGDVRTMPMQTGETTTVEVEPGNYLVRVGSPDGALADAMVDVAEGETGAVVLTAPHWLVPPSTDSPSSPPVSPPPTVPSGETRAWLELWRDGEPMEWSSVVPDGSGPGQWHLSYDGMNRLHHVMVGGPDSARRAIALPPAGSAMFSVEPVAATADFDDGLHVDVASADPRTRAMLDYLAAGQVGRAQVVAIDVVEMAVRAFQEKLVRPEGAAVAGYLLLRMRESDRLHDWGANFANWFEWLPDAQVIHAWQLLNRPGAPEQDVARTRLLNAAEIGVPCYTEGLRLLYEGLRGLSGTDERDTAVADALHRVRAYADACDWSAVMTTYWCHAPLEPSLQRHAGWGDPGPHVVRLD